MATRTRHASLRLTPWTVVRAVAMLGLTIAILGVTARSARVIGWILAAAALAGLFYPLVQTLDRRLPRALALAVVVVGSIAIVAGVSFEVVHDVTAQVHDLQKAVPAAARELEHSERFGRTARDLDLARHVKVFMNELPERLRGGDVQSALRSAATRGVAFLATTVLTIFFLIYGPKLLASGVEQLPAHRRDDLRVVGASAYRRTWLYVSGTLAMSVMAGLVAYGCATLLHLPGKAPLALWAALFDVIPIAGFLLGGFPLLLLAATTASAQGTVTVVVVIGGWQLFEALVLQRRVEHESLHLGPFVTVAVAMVGLELYGIGGVFVALVGTVVAAAVLDETLGRGPRSARPEP